jgi:predicted RNA polymerase sigma factor
VLDSAHGAPAGQDDTLTLLFLCEVLDHVSPGPVVTLNRAVALAMVEGPQAGLELLEALGDEESMRHTHRLDSVRGHLLELAGDPVSALECYRRAARMTTNVAEQRYLALRAAGLAGR